MDKLQEKGGANKLNEQTLKKRKETLRKNLKQIAAIDSTETIFSYL